MIICLRGRSKDRIVELLRDLPLTSGGSLVGFVSNRFVEGIIYVRSSTDIKSSIISMISNGVHDDYNDIIVSLSDSYMTYRPCTDCTLCLTYKGLVSYHMVYSTMIEKNVEISEPRPDIALTELLATIYDSEGEYSLEKSIEIFGDYIYRREITPKHLALSITQVRDCCMNSYVTLITREAVNIYTLKSEDTIGVFYVDPGLEEFPNVKKILRRLERHTIPKDSQYIARLGKDNVWVYQRRF